MENSTSSTLFTFKCLKADASYPVNDDFYYNYLAMIIFDSTLAPIAFVLNLLVLIVIFKNRSLQTVTNCILISLAISDMIAGLVIQPMKAGVTALLMTRRYNCALYLSSLQMGYFMGMTSYLSLTLMNIERYIAIFHAFKYHELTASRMIVLKPILAIWFFSALIMGLSFLTPNMKVMRIFVIILIPSSITWSAFVYIKAVILVRQKNQQIATVSGVDMDGRSLSVAYTMRDRKDTNASQLSNKNENANGMNLGRCNCPSKDANSPNNTPRIPRAKNSLVQENMVQISRTRTGSRSSVPGPCRIHMPTVTRKRASSFRKSLTRRLRPNSKATRLAIIIMITLCLCYIPSCTLTFLRDYSNVKADWINGVHDWGVSFVLLNSTLNPIIYCLKITEMRVKIKALLFSIWHKICRK